MFRRRDKESDDLRTFMRELLLRFDRKWEIIDAETARRFEAASEERRRYFDKLDVRTEEILAEGRAGREALFRILDRMDGKGGPAGNA